MAWNRFAVLGVLAASCYLWLPMLGQSVLYDLVGASAALAVLYGVRLHRPVSPLPWYLFAVGIALWVLGDVAFSILDLPSGEMPFPSVADGLYLAGYPVMYAAVTLMVRRRGVPDSAAWQDAAIWVLAVALLSWDGLLEPTATATGATAAARLVASAYPVMDLGLLLFVLRLITGGARRLGVSSVLALSLLAYLVSDAFYAVGELAGTYSSGSWVDLGWLLAYVCFGTCALHPAMVEVAAPGRLVGAVGGCLRLNGLLVAVLIAPALLLYQSLWAQDVDGEVIAVAAASMLVLAALRGRGLIRELEATTDRLRLREKEMHRRATTDDLTGLANRALLLEHLEAALASGEQITVALLDLDGFKQVNDSLGHGVGDALLREVSERLTGAAEQGELIARLGGDEFAVVSPAEPANLSERLLWALAPSTVLDGSAIRLGASIGLVSSGDGSLTVSQLLRHADVAMYAAKSSGGSRSEVYDAHMSVSLLRQAAMRRKLSQGLELGEFIPFFQPVVDLATFELVGFEALVRWCLPGVTPIGPDEWIASAEQAGLVGVLDEQVLRLAATQMAAWSDTGPTGAALTLAVNMSGHTLQEVDVAERVLAVLADVGFPPDRLVLEVTEGVLIDDPAVGERLQRLRAAGVRVALDDFGTGWSSLDYLRRFPVDVLKLDRSFVAGLASGGAGEAVPAAVVQLATTLGLEVIAEGVETLHQAERLSRLGDMRAQGYLFGRAEPAHALTVLVSSGRVALDEEVRPVPVGGESVEPLPARHR